MSHHVARFPKQKMAETFAEAIRGVGWSATNVARRGKTVTFDLEGEHRVGSEKWLDYAETVGYHGSPPQGPRATLDGHPTPRGY